MSYWIIQSIPGAGLFFTADTRTTADFQDGEGTFYCDAASKLFYFDYTPDTQGDEKSTSNTSKKGALCFAGTAMKYTKTYQMVSIQKVLSSIVSSEEFKKYLATPSCKDAESIFKHVLGIIETQGKGFKFLSEDGKEIDLATLIKTECAIGVGLINDKTVSLYAAGFIIDGKRKEEAHVGKSVLIGSNQNYLLLPTDATPVIPMQILNTHKKLVDDIKSNNESMALMVSDTYDQVYWPLTGAVSAKISQKVSTISDKKNYTSIANLQKKQEATVPDNTM